MRKIKHLNPMLHLIDTPPATGGAPSPADIATRTAPQAPLAEQAERRQDADQQPTTGDQAQQGQAGENGRQDAAQQQPDTFDRAYVKRLRRENAS